MRFGLYIVASMVLMIMVGGYIYSINPNSFTYTILDFPIELPVAVWFTIPMFILMVASLLHMIYYGTKNFFKFKKWDNDTDNLNNALYWSILNEPKPHKYNIPKFKEIASILNVSNIEVRGVAEGVSEKLQTILNVISEIEKGECLDLKEKRLIKVLSKDNPILIKNQINCLIKDDEFIEEVLQNRDRYNSTVFEKALKLFSKRSNFQKAKKYSTILTRESFMKLISRVTRDNDLGLTIDILDQFIRDMHESLKCSDFLLIANVTKKQLSPDENLRVFSNYQDRYTKAETAYLYLLFDYEMIEMGV